APPVQTYADPDHPSEKQVAAAAVDAVTALLLESARQRHTEEQLRRELDETRTALERSYLRPTYRWREKVVRRLRTNRIGRGLLKGYRLARGRSSPAA
ncbi:MAG: hypothetical protein WBP61_07830, partial [Nocardioides sp.]